MNHHLLHTGETIVGRDETRLHGLRIERVGGVSGQGREPSGGGQPGELQDERKSVGICSRGWTVILLVGKVYGMPNA